MAVTQESMQGHIEYVPDEHDPQIPVIVNRGRGGSPGGWMHLIAVLLSAILAVLVAGGGWVISHIISLEEDMAIVKCQLSDACRHPVFRGGPEQ